MKHTATRAPRFDREWKEMIALLPEHRQASMEQAIRDYQLYGTEPQGLDGAETMAFLLIKKIVDRRAKQRRARMRRQEANTPADKPNQTEKNQTAQNIASPTATPATKQSSEPATKQSAGNPIREKQLRHKAIIKRLNRISQNSTRIKPPKLH